MTLPARIAATTAALFCFLIVLIVAAASAGTAVLSAPLAGMRATAEIGLDGRGGARCLY